MNNLITIAALFGLVVSAALAGCTGESSKSTQQGGRGSPASIAAKATRLELPTGDERVRLDPDEFTTKIDHPYWPMKPGTRWTYRETDEEGKELDVVVVVTHQTRRIANGVTARVVRDTVIEDGELVEDTRDWYAQDANGNIWDLGEETAEFEGGEIATRAGSFEAGVDGAMAGIILPAGPRPGMRYRQEYYQGEAEDSGAVLSTEEMAQVPYGFFRDALLTKDTNALEPRVLEYKLYARGVGPVLVLGVSGGAGKEELLEVDRAPRTADTGPLGHRRSIDRR
ncbi:MAG: hypothetical protein ACRDOJ_13080 [Nocardioidaceae bacterium]